MPLTTANIKGVLINEFGSDPSGASQDLNGSGVGNSNDEFIELYNASGSPVDLSGWEIWTSNGVRHTLDPGTTIPAGGYFVSVDPGGGTSNAIQNVNGAAADYADQTYAFVDSSTVGLYDPGSNTYVIFAGATAGPSAIANLATSIETAHSGASQVGASEQGVANAMGNAVQRFADGDVNFVSDTATPGAANLCFAAGTWIATPEGERRVEDLGIGDPITTADGRWVPVRLIGRQTIVKAFAGPRAQLVRIRAGALGRGACKPTPHTDLFVTGDHGMVVDGMIVNASALVNGRSIDWVSWPATPERRSVYHVETDAHDVILANGVASETFLDMPGRVAFDNFQEYLNLYGRERHIIENPMPRIAAPRLIPDAVRRGVAVADNCAPFGATGRAG